jgi:hypothetical protein
VLLWKANKGEYELLTIVSFPSFQSYARAVTLTAPERDFPFSIPIPEALPQTVDIDRKGSTGIRYELLASESPHPQ